uniref:Peptidase M13 N-terminal domain-containing protein n=1 Tax=Romanomermis culicivorax TaxID=13658 RepID=A0A915KVU2_ROMCU
MNNKVPMTYGTNRKLSLYQASYQDAIFKILKSLGQPPDDMKQQIRDTLLFEAHLVSKMEPPESPTTDVNVNFFSLSELSSKYSQIDWLNLVEEVFRGITIINPNEAIFYVPDQSYLAFMNDMIKQTDKKILANFQLLSFIKAYISYVLPLTNDVDYENRWVDCVEEARNFFPWTLSSEYVKTITGTRTKDEVELLVHNIGRALERKIKKFSWMNGPVIDRALYKIDGLSYRISYPEFIANHRQVASHENIKLHVNNGSYAEVVAQLAAQNVASSFGRIKKLNDLDQWNHDSYPVIPDISLDLKTNTIIMTAAALQEPIFSIRYPKYVLYSRAGYLIAKALWEAVSPAGKSLQRYTGFIEKSTDFHQYIYCLKKSF